MKTLTLLLGVALVAAGCSLIPGLGGGRNPDAPQKPKNPVRLKTVSLAMSKEANSGWPAKVELVRVRDEGLANVLLRIKAADWFGTEGDAFRQANPFAQYDAWEVVPGTNIGPFKTRRRGRFAGVLFCGIQSERPPYRMHRDGNVMIYIDDEGCTVTGTSDAKGRRFLPW